MADISRDRYPEALWGEGGIADQIQGVIDAAYNEGVKEQAEWSRKAEAERDQARQTIKWLHGRVDEEIARCDAAETRLAAAEAVCASLEIRYPQRDDAYDCGVEFAVDEVRAALRGEGDRG